MHFRLGCLDVGLSYECLRLGVIHLRNVMRALEITLCPAYDLKLFTELFIISFFLAVLLLDR